MMRLYVNEWEIEMDNLTYLQRAAAAIDAAADAMKESNDTAARLAALRATDPWPDMETVMRRRAAARRYIHALALRLKAEREARP